MSLNFYAPSKTQQPNRPYYGAKVNGQHVISLFMESPSVLMRHCLSFSCYQFTPTSNKKEKKTRMLNYQVILRSTSQMHCMNVEKVEFNDMHTHKIEVT